MCYELKEKQMRLGNHHILQAYPAMDSVAAPKDVTTSLCFLQGGGSYAE